MTVEYNAEVSTVSFSGFLKLLIRWRGSIYKLLWKDFLLFAVLFGTLAFLYHRILTGDHKKNFEDVVDYCNKFQENIPISFILGFYVATVVSRWWEQFNTIPWPSRLAIFVTSYIRGQDERSRLIRRSVMRYVSLSFVMTMSSISTPVRKRFPTFLHMVEAGFMLPNELEIIESLATSYNKYYVPCMWASTLVAQARKEGRITSDFALQAIVDEINSFRQKTEFLFRFDFVSIPLVYTQVATLAVYVFFIACLMGRQYVEESGNGDLIFPLFTFLQYFFYMGWLKVAEELLNPFGEDDDDFDINALIDRNLKTSYLIVDDMFEELPELVKDQYWDSLQIQIPYTEAALEHYKEAPLGSAETMSIPERQQQFVQESLSKLSLIEEHTDLDDTKSVKSYKSGKLSVDGISVVKAKRHESRISVVSVSKRDSRTSIGSIVSQIKMKLSPSKDKYAETPEIPTPEQRVPEEDIVPPLPVMPEQQSAVVADEDTPKASPMVTPSEEEPAEIEPAVTDAFVLQVREALQDIRKSK